MTLASLGHALGPGLSCRYAGAHVTPCIPVGPSPGPLGVFSHSQYSHLSCGAFGSSLLPTVLPRCIALYPPPTQLPPVLGCSTSLLCPPSSAAQQGAAQISTLDLDEFPQLPICCASRDLVRSVSTPLRWLGQAFICSTWPLHL